MVARVEPAILECEVKWALGSITMKKASGGSGIPTELFKILKDNAVKAANSENSAVATGPKRSVFIPIPKKGNGKECSCYCTIALISSARKVLLKILQPRLQRHMNQELPDSVSGMLTS